MLEFEEYRQKLNTVKPKLEVLRGALKLDAAEREIEELEAASAREGFWNDVEKSQKVQKRLKTLQNKRDNYNRLCSNWDDLMTLCDMAIEEDDDSLLEELQADYAVQHVGRAPRLQGQGHGLSRRRRGRPQERHHHD